MDIKHQAITVRDLVAGYMNDPDHGVRGYGGRLDIRPPYQREFRYDTKQKQAVVNTILKGFPLNIMYWSVVNDEQFEMIDGQQRTLAICESTITVPIVSERRISYDGEDTSISALSAKLKGSTQRNC
jgi:hypothetical protein